MVIMDRGASKDLKEKRANRGFRALQEYKVPLDSMDPRV